jgi:beta-fructofuranosidase
MWYLVFSRLNRDMHRKTFYRIADNPNGPWRIFRDENGKHETFDGL